MRGGVQNRISPEPLKSYYPVVQWDTVKLMLILWCIIGFQGKSIDFTNFFAQAYFKSVGGKCGVVIRLKKSLYDQAEATRLWCEKLRNGLLDLFLVVSKVDP